jgi:UDP-3-O-[3-hydroxymyristoyl] glucosamine N-acyltransferase
VIDMEITLGHIAEHLGAELRNGSPETRISGLGTIQSAGSSQLSFLANPKYRSFLENTRAGAVICHADQAGFSPVPVLVVEQPYLAFAKASHLFDRAPRPAAGVHPSAVVDQQAVLEEGVSVGPNAVIERGACVGAGSVIMANCYVGEYARLGQDVRLWPNVTIYHGVTIGDRSTIHSNSVIGSDGFGFAPGRDGWSKVAQVGGVSVGNDVEIGSGTTIDRGAIDDTVIGNGVIIDNQVQVAHNVVVGDHTALAGQVGIAGSAKIGSRCLLGGAVGVSGHLEICDDVQVLGMTLVSGSITEPGIYASGMPADKHRKWRKNTARFRHLDELYRRVVKLEKKLPRGE